YEESLDSMLGDFSEALIVDTVATAENVTRFLSENRMGSVSFVIMERVAGGDAQGVPGEAYPGLYDITNIVFSDEKYSGVLKALLKNVYAANSPEEARRSFEGSGSFDRLVVCGKGEVYGGVTYKSPNFSDKEIVSVFGRREKVKEMVGKKALFQSEIDTIGASIRELKEWMHKAQFQKRDLENHLRKKSMEFSDISSKRMVIKEKNDALDEQLLAVNNEINELSGEIKRKQDEVNEMNTRLKELDEQDMGLKREMEEANNFIQGNVHKREQLSGVFSDIKVELSAMRKEEEHIRENLEREKMNFTRLAVDIDEKKESGAESVRRIGELKIESESLTELSKEYSKLKEEKIFQGAEKKGQKDRLAGLLGVQEKELREKEERLEAIRNQAHDFDMQIKEVEYRRTNLYQRVHETYKVDLSAVTVEYEETFDMTATEEKINELRDRIEKLGPVSLGAVEEHKELKDRFEFLVKQRDDLTMSREDLIKAISKINRTTKTLFMETFEKIKKEFNDYFRMLFNGGKAELVLMDENDALECGIEIVVRPPGKKLQNIMLLSGGEKAMTAIALIFAIFKVNPSPFCILDEIDAPLDESNVVRFCNVLQDFIKMSQFIIVTHNKMTIQLADVLYGITIEEKGVSKVVSVKFAERGSAGIPKIERPEPEEETASPAEIKEALTKIQNRTPEEEAELVEVGSPEESGESGESSVSSAN
ncbi:MAG: hypothetical protein HQL28_07120, partial [Candidatus Omnitrophica bacterium]|nr:hypothetical protein [Candidatus Omnitrophota bacterium]